MNNSPPRSRIKGGPEAPGEKRPPWDTEKSPVLSHPLYSRSERRLRELVVCLGSHDGMALISVLLSRVPALGEEVAIGGRIYRVIGVQHATLNPDGRAALGTHAHHTVVEVPDEGYLKRPKSPTLGGTRRKRSRRKLAPE